MPSFLTDKNGVSQKDYIILYTTVVYGILMLSITLAVLIRPAAYTQDILTFLLDITKSISLAYGAIVSTFFAGTSGINIAKIVKNVSKPDNVAKTDTVSKSNETTQK